MEKISSNVQKNNNILTEYNKKKLDNTKKVEVQKKLALRGLELKKANKKVNKDVKLDISDAVKEFTKIKKAIADLPAVDNSKKVQDIKSKIANKEYKIDYDKLAEKILKNEF